MIPTIKLYLDTRSVDVESDAIAPIKLMITYKRVSFMLPTNIKIKPSCWDKPSRTIIKMSNRLKVNAYLTDIQRKVEAQLMQWSEDGSLRGMTPLDIKKKLGKSLTDDGDNGNETNVVKRFDVSMSTRKGRTKEIYAITLKRIMDFDKDYTTLMLDDINKLWLDSFDKFLSKTSPSANARAIHMRNIRAVFNDAIDDGVTTFYPFRTYKIKTTETIKRSLDIEQLRDVFDMKVDEEHRKYLDIFKLIFYLIGINTVDLCNLKSINNGRIEYYRAKTKRLYSIKVEPEAMAIIDKYRGKNYLLDILDNTKSYLTFAHKLNIKLQEMTGNLQITTKKRKGRTKQIWTRNENAIQLSTYWARHTWASIASYLDIPIDTISAALGHKNGSRVTSVYIRFDDKKVDEANRKVIDFVNEISKKEIGQ